MAQAEGAAAAKRAQELVGNLERLTEAMKKQEADATEEVRTLALPCTRNVSSLWAVLRSVSYVKPAPREGAPDCDSLDAPWWRARDQFRSRS